MRRETLHTVDTPSPWERLTYLNGALAGGIQVAFTVLFFAFVLPHLAPLDATDAQFAAVMAQQSHNPLYLLSSFLLVVQLPFLAVFFGGLHGLLRRAEGGSGALAGGVFAAGIALALITPLACLIEDHLLLGLAAAGADPVIVRAMDGLVPLSLAVSGLAQMVVLVGTGMILGRVGLLPRWLARAGYGCALVSLLGVSTLAAADLFPLALLATLLFKLWLIGVSVALLRRPTTADLAVAGRVTA